MKKRNKIRKIIGTLALLMNMSIAWGQTPTDTAFSRVQERMVTPGAFCLSDADVIRLVKGLELNSIDEVKLHRLPPEIKEKSRESLFKGSAVATVLKESSEELAKDRTFQSARSTLNIVRISFPRMVYQHYFKPIYDEASHYYFKDAEMISKPRVVYEPQHDILFLDDNCQKEFRREITDSFTKDYRSRDAKNPWTLNDLKRVLTQSTHMYVQERKALTEQIFYRHFISSFGRAFHNEFDHLSHLELGAVDQDDPILLRMFEWQSQSRNHPDPLHARLMHAFKIDYHAFLDSLSFGTQGDLPENGLQSLSPRMYLAHEITIHYENVGSGVFLSNPHLKRFLGFVEDSSVIYKEPYFMMEYLAMLFSRYHGYNQKYYAKRIQIIAKDLEIDSFLLPLQIPMAPAPSKEERELILFFQNQQLPEAQDEPVDRS